MNKVKSFTVEFDIERDVLENIFVTAIEGGSGYWAYIPAYAIAKVRSATENGDPFSIRLFKAVIDKGVEVDVLDAETDEKIGTLSLDNVKKGISTILNDAGYRYALFDEINGQGDANTSDVLFQFMALGSLDYC